MDNPNMYYMASDLARLRTQEEVKRGLESQRYYQDLAASKIINRTSRPVSLRTQIRELKWAIQDYLDKVQCRILGKVYSRPC
jgi:hypothetical protein